MSDKPTIEDAVEAGAAITDPVADLPSDSSDGEFNRERHSELADRRNGGSDGILGRLTLSEWLTLWVGLASLVVSYLTYRNASDTKELRLAVRSLADLAAQTKRQADISHSEITLLREQVQSAALQAEATQKLVEPTRQSALASLEQIRNQSENFATEQRPILVLNNEAPSPAHGGPQLVDSLDYVRWNYAIENIGKSAATEIVIETGISVLNHRMQVAYFSGGELSPGKKQWSTARYFVNDDERESLIEPNTEAIERLLSKVTYRDSFGHRYSTLSCLEHFSNGATGICDYAQTRAQLGVVTATNR